MFLQIQNLWIRENMTWIQKSRVSKKVKKCKSKQRLLCWHTKKTLVLFFAVQFPLWDGEGVVQTRLFQSPIFTSPVQQTCKVSKQARCSPFTRTKLMAGHFQSGVAFPFFLSAKLWVHKETARTLSLDFSLSHSLTENFLSLEILFICVCAGEVGGKRAGIWKISISASSPVFSRRRIF